MLIRLKGSALKETKGYEYLVRFGLGGITTVLAGVIADRFGPATGGLFLAFPAIFCASATLIEKHERERKQREISKERNAAAPPQPLMQPEPRGAVSRWPDLPLRCGLPRRLAQELRCRLLR